MSSLHLYSEDIDGRHIVYALDLPGCFTEGMSEDEALQRFPLAWASYADWLVAHGDGAPTQPDRLIIVERFTSYVLSDGYEVNALFAPERRPPSQRFVTRCQRLLGHSRADLLATWQRIPPDRQEASPAGQRTPLQILEHVACAEWWYQSHIRQFTEDSLTNALPGSISQLADVRASLLDWLSTASIEELRIVSVSDEEGWSVRKALRRALWHERTHTAELAHFLKDGLG